jgi:hypothetical protein
MAAPLPRLAALLALLCAVLGVAAACGSGDGPGARQAGATGRSAREGRPPVRHGAVILGCGAYCRSASVTDANREAPETDVFPPYAARWKVTRDWAPFPDGTAPITVTCDAGLPCAGAIFLTIYSPSRTLAARQRVIGRSDLRVAPHSTQTIGVPLDRPGLERVRTVLKACRRYRASTGAFPPDPNVGLTIDARASRDRLPPRHRHFLTWVYFTGLVCA